MQEQAQGFGQARDLEQERRAREAQGFGREAQLFQQGLQGRQFGLQEQAQGFGQGLANRQFGLQEQAQGFGQGLQALGAGLDVLRSPGDYWRYQRLLRDNQSPATPYTGQQLVSRDAFLAPFAQRLAGELANGGQQGLASQAATPGLGQALSGQTVDRPRQLPAVGAPPFLSLQDYARLLPSEREMRTAEIGALGIPLQDYAEQERRTYPRGFGPSHIRLGARQRVAR